MQRSVVLSLLLFVSNSFAQTSQSIGVVELKFGEVTRRSDNGMADKPSRGSRLFKGDRIRTRERSFVHMRLDDDHRFDLGKNAEAVLLDFPSDKPQEIIVLTGGFRYTHSGTPGSDTAHTVIRTPSAVVRLGGKSKLEGYLGGTKTSFVHRSGISVFDLRRGAPVTLTKPGDSIVIDEAFNAEIPEHASEPELIGMPPE